MIKTVTVTVTQDHIEKGQGWLNATGAMRCAIDYALEDAGLTDFRMGLGRIYKMTNGGAGPTIRISVPIDVDRWREHFDAGWVAQPITFEIDVPEQYLTTEA